MSLCTSCGVHGCNCYTDQIANGLIKVVTLMEARINGLERGVLMNAVADMDSGPKSAVVIVDMQNDFVPVESAEFYTDSTPTGSKALDDLNRIRKMHRSAWSRGDYSNTEEMKADYVSYGKVIMGVNRLLARRKMDMFVFSKDFHPKDHISFQSNREYWKRNLEDVDENRTHHATEVRHPEHCVQGTWGCGIVKDVRYSPLVVDKILDGSCHYVLKGDIGKYEGYSAFFKGKGVDGMRKPPGIGSEEFRNLSTGLYEKLRENNITRLYLCGVAQNICVCDTARDAAALGFETIFVNDACKPLILPAYNEFIQSPEDTVMYLRQTNGITVCNIDNVSWNSDDKKEDIDNIRKRNIEEGKWLRGLLADIGKCKSSIEKWNGH